MSKAGVAKTSELVYDGKSPQRLNFGPTAWAVGAVSNLGSFVAPCDLEIVGIHLHSPVAATSAAAKVNIGIQGDSDSCLDGYLVQNLTGAYDVPMTDPLLVNKYVNKGDIVSAELEAATAVGTIAGTVVFMPRQG